MKSLISLSFKSVQRFDKPQAVETCRTPKRIDPDYEPQIEEVTVEFGENKIHIYYDYLGQMKIIMGTRHQGIILDVDEFESVIAKVAQLNERGK